MLNQLFASFSTAKITYIKEKPFLRKLVTLNTLLNQNDVTVVVTFLLELNDLSDKDNTLIIGSPVEHIIT